MTPEPVNVADYERLAADRLADGPLGYYAGGAGGERTLRENVAAYPRPAPRPRGPVDGSGVSTATTVLGTGISMPVIVAPVALQKMAHPDGECGMARAAADAGTIMTVSTIATSTPREVAAAAPGAPRWFQVYVFKDRGVTRAMIDEAIDCGYTALALTVDAPRAGRRERDFRTGFSGPPCIVLPAGTSAGGASTGISPQGVFSLLDQSLTWTDLEQLIADSPVPVLLKGVQTGEDARLA